MIYNKIDSSDYKKEFNKKFENFGEKAPIMLSYATDDFGVTVVHENSGKSYYYEWDFSINVKAMIHKIKQDLSNNHYPRIAHRMEIVKAITPERAAELIAGGIAVDDVPTVETEIRDVIYRIDKIIAMKDEFVLVDEQTRDQYCYKMNSSGIFFLKNYRNNKYNTLYEAGEAFFAKSSLVSKLNKKAVFWEGIPMIGLGRR